jgi:hypothetical protein
MANTFTPATQNWGTSAVPLPGVATMSSGGVTAPLPVSPSGGQTYIPMKPLPGPTQGPTFGNTV